MNGTIDLSSRKQGFQDKPLQYVINILKEEDKNTKGEEIQREVVRHKFDDDYSWSETSTSCSCSSCSTCSLCDVENGNNAAFDQFSQMSLQENDNTLMRTIDKANRYQTRDDILYSSKNVTAKKYQKSNNSRTATKYSLEQPMTGLESNYTTYSSGSDKEMTYSSSSSIKSSMTRNADSSSEISSTEHSTGNTLELDKRKKQVKKKKVTFLETSMSSADQSNHSYTCQLDAHYFRVMPFEGDTLKVIQKPNTIPMQNQCLFQEETGNTIPTDEQNTHKVKKLDNLESNKKLSSEYIRLQNILKNIDPFTLQSILRHQLEKKDARTVLTLGRLFPKRSFPAATIHCVRCHKEYNPHFGKMRCELAHPINSLIKLCEEDQTACYRCCVCKKEYWVNILEDDIAQIKNHLGFCFIGTHTPTADDVRYAPLGAAKSCEDMGCIEFYV
jgi:hypothetical protein